MLVILAVCFVYRVIVMVGTFVVRGMFRSAIDTPVLHAAAQMNISYDRNNTS